MQVRRNQTDFGKLVRLYGRAGSPGSFDELHDLTTGMNGAYVEFRDAKVAMFLRQLSQGKHTMSYRMRAEIPGTFAALPTLGQGMYAAELRSNADQFSLSIGERAEVQPQ